MIQPRSLPALSCHSLHLSYHRKEVLQSSMAELLAVPEFLGKLTHHTEGSLVNHPWANRKSKRCHLKWDIPYLPWLRDTLSYLLHLFLIPTVISWNIKLRCAQLAVVLAVPEKLWNYGMWLQKFACWTGKLKRINYLQRNSPGSHSICLNAHAGIMCTYRSSTVQGWRKTSKNDPKRTCRTKQLKKTSSRQS